MAHGFSIVPPLSLLSLFPSELASRVAPHANIHASKLDSYGIDDQITFIAVKQSTDFNASADIQRDVLCSDRRIKLLLCWEIRWKTLLQKQATCRLAMLTS